MLKHYASTLVEGFEWKSVLSILGSAIALIEGFYGGLLWGFLILFVLDLLSGILKSHFKGIAITSKRLRDSVVKLGGYMILMTTLIVLSKYQSDIVPVIAWTYYYFMFTEAKSILENVQEMGVKFPGVLNVIINGRLAKLDQQTINEGEGEKDAGSDK